MNMRNLARKLITATACLLLPGRILAYSLPLLGHAVSPQAKIGFSVLFSDKLVLGDNARVGHFNLIAVRRVVLQENARIGTLNVVRGPLSLWLQKDASIGNRNVVARARRGVTYGPAELRLGERTKITADHKIDCTASIRFGDFSILAGSGSQIWTHGYVHEETGPGRYRVDGPVNIGDNVYVGSRVNITGGVTIASGVIVGVGVTVARDLTEPGMYVAAPLRMLPKPKNPIHRDDMRKIKSSELVETVYRKINAAS